MKGSLVRGMVLVGFLLLAGLFVPMSAAAGNVVGVSAVFESEGTLHSERPARDEAGSLDSAAAKSSRAFQPFDWRMKLVFTEPVAVLELTRQLVFKINGKERPLRIHDGSSFEPEEEQSLDASGSSIAQRQPRVNDDSRTVFIIGPRMPLDEIASCEITLPAGVKALSGAKTAAPFSLPFTVRPFLSLVSLTHEFTSKTDNGLTLEFSGPVDPRKVGDAIRIIPSVGRLQVVPAALDSKNSVKVMGAFVGGSSYRLIIKPTVINDDGACVAREKRQFDAAGPQPSVHLNSSSHIIERNGRQILPIQMKNLKGVRCRLTGIPPLFAPRFCSFVFPNPASSQQRGEDEDTELEADAKDLLEKNVRLAEQYLFSGLKRVDSLEKLASPSVKPGNPGKKPLPWGPFMGRFSLDTEAFVNDQEALGTHQMSLPMTFRANPRRGGIFLLEIGDPEASQVVPRYHLIQITDLAITFKRSQRKLLLWVTSLESAKPVAGARVMVSDLDGRRYFLGETDAQGIIEATQGQSFPTLSFVGDKPIQGSGTLDLSTAARAVVTTADDACCIGLSNGQFKPFGVRQVTPGTPFELPRNGHLFTERGVYKQGETVFWKASARACTKDGIIAPDREAVEIRVNDPRGGEVLRETHRFNEFGTCSGTIPISGFAPLGNYTIEMYHVADGEAVTAVEDDTEAAASETFPDADKTEAEVAGQETASETDDPGLGEPLDENPNDESERSIAEKKHPETPSANQGQSSGQEAGADDTALAATGFQVQNFEPPRHFVTLTTSSRKRVLMYESGISREEPYLECTVAGTYYTGGPVRHGKVRWAAFLKMVSQEIPGFERFIFGGSSEDENKTLIETGEAVLDGDGKLTFGIPLDSSVIGGLSGFEVSATVLDVDALPATTVETWKPSPVFQVGIGRLPEELRDGDEISIPVVVLNEGKVPLASGQIRVEVFRGDEARTYKRGQDGTVRRSYEQIWIRESMQEQSLTNGTASVFLRGGAAEKYRLEVSYEANGTTFQSLCEFKSNARDDEEEEDGRNRRKSDEEVFLGVSKPMAKVGETVFCDFTLPRPAGTVLMTCESASHIEHHVVPVKGRTISVPVLVKPEFWPHVYVSVTVPTGRGSFPIYRASFDRDYPRVYYGYAELAVRSEITGLSIGIADEGKPSGKAELRGRPGEWQTLELNVTDASGTAVDAEIAVAVVDEAVLALTGYPTPNLSVLSRFIRPLEILTGDLRLDLVTQEVARFFATNPLTGGDMGAGVIAADIDPRKEFRPVAFWNAGLRPDKAGKIKIGFTLPDNTTTYRVFAVGLDRRQAFCSAQRMMVVTKDFFLQPALPRFLVEGDEMTGMVSAANKTAKAGSAEIRVVEAKQFTAVIPTGTVTLPAYTTAGVPIRLRADSGQGKASLTVQGRLDSHRDAITQDFQIKSPYAQGRLGKVGGICGTEAIDLPLPKELSMVPEGDRVRGMSGSLRISLTPWEKLGPGLEYLLEYPHGCVEQTSSRVIPLAALRALVNNGKAVGLGMTLGEIDRYLKPGVLRLLRMQTMKGGFSYWPGETETCWWGSQYAVLALTMAKEAGFPVDEKRLSAAVDYFAAEVGKSTGGDITYDRGISALVAVNLALNGRLSRLQFEALASRFRIGKGGNDEIEPVLAWAGALAKALSADEVKAMVGKLDSTNRKTTSSWYHSWSRGWALALLATLEADPDSRFAAAEIAERLLRNIGPEGRWDSTADTGLCLYALGKFFQKTVFPEKDKVEVTVSQGAQGPVRTVKIGTDSAIVDLDMPALLVDPHVTIFASSTTMVHWSAMVRYPQVALASESAGFRITKTITNLNGREEVRVGDLVKCVIEFEATEKHHRSGGFEDLAIEDPLPAGLLAINTALKNDTPDPAALEKGKEDSEEAADEEYEPWVDGAYQLRPSHAEFQDDRVAVFKDSVFGAKYRYTYFARAIAEGRFRLRPTTIGLMYDPTVQGMTGASTLVIHPAR